MATFMLIPGAWHGAWCWFKVIPLLEQRGHRVHTLDLPAHGLDQTNPAAATLESYVARLGQALDACNEPAIVVGHSAGGISLSQVAEYRPAKIAKLVYLTALVVPNGLSAAEAFQHMELPLVSHSTYSADGSSSMLRPEVLHKLVYQNCSASDLALARLLLTPEPTAPYLSPVHTTAQNWGAIPRVYIECLDDYAVPITTQRAMHQHLQWEQVLTLPADHSPFFSMPEELVEHLVSLVAT